MTKIHCKIALFIIWLVIMLPIVDAQSMSFAEPTRDTTPPAISTVQLTHGPQTIVTWTTDEASNSKIDYGNTTTLDQVANKADMETAHSLTLQTTPGIKHHYRITSCDTAGNCKSTPVESFVAGTFYIQATIPRYAKSTKLDIPGSTRPGATVSVIVNGAEVRKDEVADGEFLFKNIQLLKAANTIKFKSTLGAETAEADYQVDVDDQPPLMNVTLPTVVTNQTATAKIKVSEPVNLTVELAKPTGEKPLRPTELKAEKTEANRVDLSWKEVPKIKEYGVYRNDKKIAVTTTTQYTDTTVGAGKQYKYQISAVNDKCVESDISDILTVQTPPGQNAEQPAQEKLFSCEKAKQTYALEAGQKDIIVPLQEGENFITFTAVDKAGYKSLTEERVLYDTGPPKILETNLKQISPSYTQEVTVKGKLSERGSVTAFVNGKPQKTEPTAEDGTFSIKVKLERSINYTAEQTRSSLDTGISWKSKIRLEAIDAAGLKTSSDETEMEYALCGSGTWINVQMTEPMPEILNPRLLIEGIQQLGLAFNYEYKGGYGAVINPRDIRVKKMNLAPEFQKEYDNGLVTTYTPPVRAQKGKKPTGAGYVQINFQAIENPWALPEKNKELAEEKEPGNATMYNREDRISRHREGDCLAPGFGCVRLFLELEIPFQEEVEQLGYLPEQKAGTIEPKKLINRVQRTCINIEVAIDKRIPPDYIPSGLLRGISDVLTTIIDTIDKIITPIETIGKYLFYACVASTFLSFVPIFLEKYNCEYKKFEAIAGGGGAFKQEVAEIGACEKEYAGQEESLDNCKTCAEWKNNRRKFERTYRQICDRVMCPTAPSLQYYLKTKGRQKITPVTVKDPGQFKDGQKVGGAVNTGSDCAAWMKKNQIKAQEEEDIAAKSGPKAARKIPPSKFFTTNQIEDIYKDWLKHQDDTTDETTQSDTSCAGLHPASPECCGYEYMQEWSSACGTSALGSGLDTFDEIKESTCLAEQKGNKNEIPLGGTDKEQCSKLLNAAAGFCDKEGQQTPETIPVVPFEGGPEKANSMQARLGLAGQKERFMYLLMIPKKEAKEYEIKLGYVVETVEFDRTDQSKGIMDERRHAVSAKLQGIELPDTKISIEDQFFTPDQINKHQQNAVEPGFYDRFTAYLCSEAGYGENTRCGANGKDVYSQAAAKIGSPDREYIIRPGEGLINSIRCLCFPTIIGYLKLWRKIMIEVRNCVNTILLTGDGEAGVCQAIISKYVCDLLYEVLACFTQKFGSPGSGGARGEGPGDIMGALTSAGTEMSRSVESRYGDSGMYKATFVDRKLVHSICMFAFTGTWNFDLGTIFDQSIDTIPIDSQALLMPCNRRFVSFNPSTRPPGLTTWVYHFGAFIAAGADIDVELHLVCSGGFHCKESEGFEGGKCDCTAPRDVVIMPQELPTRIKKNDIISQEIFYTMTAGPQESQIRYDKAYLKYYYKEGKTGKITPGQTDPCSIGLTGGPGTVPAFCRFDPLGQSFRCSFGEVEGAIRFKSAKANYPHKIPTEVFAVKDNLDVELQIQQDYPGQESHAKHLQFDILNPSGHVIETNNATALLLLTTNGDYVKPIGPDKSQYPLVIKKEWFGGEGPGGAQVHELFISAEGVKGASIPIIERSSAKIVEQGIPTTGQYVIELKLQGGNQVYAVHKGTTPGETPTGFAKVGQICSGPTPLANGEIICQDGGKTITVRLTDVRPSTAARQTGSYEVYIGFGQIPGATPCQGADRLRAQPFKIRFTAFDSDKYGQPTEQVTLDPMTGQEGMVELPLSIVCAANDDTDFKELVDRQKGILPPSEIIKELARVLDDMIRKENNDKKMMERFLTEQQKLDLRVSEISGYSDTIVANELQHAGQLQQTILKLEKASEEIQKELKPPIVNLHNRLKQLDMSGETDINPAENIIYASNEIKKEIAALPPPGDSVLRTTLRAYVALMDDIILEKIRLNETLSKYVKVETKPCPLSPGQEEPDGFYTCSEKNLTTVNPAWQPAAGRQCFTATEQKCYTLPKENNCSGAKEEKSFKCVQECTGKQVPVTSWSETTAEGTKIEHKLACPLSTTKCCAEALTGYEKLMKLRDDIRFMLKSEQGYIEQLVKKKHIGYPERTIDEMRRRDDGETANTILIQSIIDAETAAQKKLKATLDAYTIGQQEDVKPPKDVNEILFGKIEIDFSEELGHEIRIPIAGTPAVIKILGEVKSELKNIALDAPPDPKEVREQLDKAIKQIEGLNILKINAIMTLNKLAKQENCEVGYSSDGGIATSCFKFACPQGGYWKEVRDVEGKMPACLNKDDMCCQARLSPPLILAGGKPLVEGQGIFFPAGQTQEFTIKVPLLDEADLDSYYILFSNEDVSATKSYSKESGVATFNFKKAITDTSEVYFGYSVKGITVPSFSSTAEVECIKPATCLKECVKGLGQEKVSRTCSKAEQDAGKKECCVTLASVAQITDEAKRRNVIAYLSKYDLEKLPKKDQNEINFCAFVDAIPGFNYGKNVLGGSINTLWPENSTFEHIPPPGKTFVRAVTESLDPGGNAIEEEYIGIKRIFYNDENNWEVEYIDLGKHHPPHKLPGLLSNQQAEAEGGAQPFKYFDNSRDGNHIIKVGKYCNVEIDTKYQGAATWYATSEVVDSGKIIGTTQVISHNDGPWYTYGTQMESLLVPRADKIIKVDRSMAPVAPGAPGAIPAVGNCGDGKIDSGEICDWQDASRKKVIARKDPIIGYPGTTYALEWTTGDRTAQTDGSIKIVKFDTQGRKVMTGMRGGLDYVKYIGGDAYCGTLAGTDCDEPGIFSVEKGYCSSDCKTFKPRFRCYDPDAAGDKGASQWYAPTFSYTPSFEITVNEADAQYINSNTGLVSTVKGRTGSTITIRSNQNACINTGAAAKWETWPADDP